MWDDKAVQFCGFLVSSGLHVEVGLLHLHGEQADGVAGGSHDAYVLVIAGNGPVVLFCGCIVAGFHLKELESGNGFASLGIFIGELQQFLGAVVMACFQFSDGCCQRAVEIASVERGCVAFSQGFVLVFVDDRFPFRAFRP